MAHFRPRPFCDLQHPYKKSPEIGIPGYGLNDMVRDFCARDGIGGGNGVGDGGGFNVFFSKKVGQMVPEEFFSTAILLVTEWG